MSGVTWTKQVSFAEALPLWKLVPGLTIVGHTMGHSGNSDPFPSGQGKAETDTPCEARAAGVCWGRRKASTRPFLAF